MTPVIAMTGGSAGIGQACAERLSADGAAVVLSARRADRLHALAAKLRARGGRVHVVPSRKAWWLAIMSVVAPARTDRLVQRWERPSPDGSSRS